MTAGLSQAALVAHYTFDEGSGTTAADSAGGDQNASTNQGTVGWSAGKIGGALDLPGNASMTAADALTTGATALTISGWVNMDDTPGYDGIFQSRGPSGEVWGLNVRGGSAADERIDFRFPNEGGGSAGYGTANGSIATGTWYHLAMTWTSDGVNSTGLTYLDGILVSTQTSAANNVTLSYTSYTSWNIGDDQCCGGRELNAQLDDIAVWDEVLSPTQILAIKNGGDAGLNAPEALAAVPEPSTSLLGALAALALLRRRR